MQYPTINDAWGIQKNMKGMTRRFDFESYSDTRRFLDDLADLSERSDYYPNLNFTRTHVNVNIESEKLDAQDYAFAAKADALLQCAQIQGGN